MCTVQTPNKGIGVYGQWRKKYIKSKTAKLQVLFIIYCI
jgi:hypothetical protein